MRYVIIITGSLAALLILFVAFKAAEVNRGKERATAEIRDAKYAKLIFTGSISNLTVLPLVDYYSDNKELKTESGVSYLIRADNRTILMDVGENRKKEHPSPLLHNMRRLGIKTGDIQMIVITHIHPDHVGGMKEMSDGSFSLSRGKVSLGSITAYTPAEMKPSSWNPDVKVEVVKEPRELVPGVASIGTIPRSLFLLGYTNEQALAVRMKGKGIVLIIGCGHQTIERIIKRAKMLFNEPVYAVIGGLHFPVNGGRAMLGPVNIQKLVGADAPPWNGLGENDVLSAIDVLKKVKPALIGVSPHDSSDWSLAKFKEAFQESYEDVKVGKEIKI